MRRICIALIWLAAIVTSRAQDLVHTVDAGETLISIASAYGVSLEQLLTLNAIDIDAILPIGRQLIVIPEEDLVDEAEPADENTEAGEAANVEISTTSVEGLPPAPLVAADAPMIDPADISPRLCFAVFADVNQNGMREPGEDYLGDAAILLLDGTDAEVAQYRTDGQSEPHCQRDLLRQNYRIRALAPEGFGLTSAGDLRLDLRDGGHVQVEFGAKPGLRPAVGPLLQPVAQDDSSADISQPSILRELSGLFVLLLAGLVFFSGLVVSIFLRAR